MRRLFLPFLLICLTAAPATPAYANCMMSWGTFKNYISVFLLAVLLLIIAAIFHILRTKPRTKARIATCVIFTAVSLAVGYKLYLSGFLPVQPCCTARQISVMSISCRSSCKYCPDSPALRPPIKPEQIISDGLMKEGREYLILNLFPPGTSLAKFKGMMKSVGLREVKRLCDAEGKTLQENISAFIHKADMPCLGGTCPVLYLYAVKYEGDKIISTTLEPIEWLSKARSIRELADAGNPEAQRTTAAEFARKKPPDYEEAYFWMGLAMAYLDKEAPWYYTDNQNKIKSNLSASQIEESEARIKSWRGEFAKKNPEGLCVPFLGMELKAQSGSKGSE